jgi:hypothetical protein
MSLIGKKEGKCKNLNSQITIGTKVSRSLPVIVLLHSILKAEIQLSGKLGTKVGLISCQNLSTSSV